MAKLNPYINFRGQAREAMSFYASVFGGEPTFSTFADFQMPGIAPEDADKIMHSQLETPAGFNLMVSDAPSSMPLDQGSSITISLSGDESDDLRDYWAKLSEGATIGMPLEAAPWGDSFGQLTDKFSVSWLVNIAGAAQGGSEDVAGTGTADDAAPEEI